MNARLSVVLDVSKTLARAMNLDGEAKDSGFWQHIEYEGNNAFCTKCGLIIGCLPPNPICQDIDLIFFRCRAKKSCAGDGFEGRILPAAVLWWWLYLCDGGGKVDGI